MDNLITKSYALSPNEIGIIEANRIKSDGKIVSASEALREIIGTVKIPVIGTIEPSGAVTMNDTGKRILAVGRGDVVTVCPHERQVTDTKLGNGPDDYREIVVCKDCCKELTDDEIIPAKE
jgi:hypothetical protein